MADLSDIARHWARQSQLRRGIRLEAAQLDLLNAIGIGEILAAKAAEIQREEARQRQEARKNVEVAVDGRNRRPAPGYSDEEAARALARAKRASSPVRARRS